MELAKIAQTDYIVHLITLSEEYCVPNAFHSFNRIRLTHEKNSETALKRKQKNKVKDLSQ